MKLTGASALHGVEFFGHGDRLLTYYIRFEFYQNIPRSRPRNRTPFV
ncbi:hypothetical protein [Nostoc sp. FACHB-133]|nr:hypothetical protein [Nostoc sp. FACHB-133]